MTRLRFALAAFVRAWRSFDARPTLPPSPSPLGPYRAPAPTPALDYVPVHERRLGSSTQAVLIEAGRADYVPLSAADVDQLRRDLDSMRAGGGLAPRLDHVPAPRLARRHD